MSDSSLKALIDQMAYEIYRDHASRQGGQFLPAAPEWAFKAAEKFFEHAMNRPGGFEGLKPKRGPGRPKKPRAMQE